MDVDFSSQLLRLRDPAGQYRDGRYWQAVDALRPMSLLKADLPVLFSYAVKDELLPAPERARSRQETLVLPGGLVMGQWPGLSAGHLDRQVDLAVTTDYLAVLRQANRWHSGYGEVLS